MSLKKPFNYSQNGVFLSQFSRMFLHPCRFDILCNLKNQSHTMDSLQSKFNLSRSSLREHLQFLITEEFISFSYISHFHLIHITDEGIRYLTEAKRIANDLKK